jgi:hypothetical protein
MNFNLDELVEACTLHYNEDFGERRHWVSVSDNVKDVRFGVEYTLYYHIKDSISCWTIGKLVQRRNGLIEVYGFNRNNPYLGAHINHEPSLRFNPFEDDPEVLTGAIDELVLKHKNKV